MNFQPFFFFFFWFCDFGRRFSFRSAMGKDVVCCQDSEGPILPWTHEKIKVVSPVECR